MKKFTGIWMILLSIIFVGPVYGAQTAGDNAIQLSGGFFHAQDTDIGTVTLDVLYGYHLTGNWEIGARQILTYDFIDDADDTWLASTSPFVQYNFRGISQNDSIQPFLGAFIGVVYNDDDVTGTMGPNVGFKAFLNEKTYLATSYRYEWFFDDIEWGDATETSHGNHVVTMGLGFLW
ncbi:MAG: hypothetical protein ACOYVJ_06595 [Nitrospirota bacterium]